jgi:hypothetical protein
MHRQSNVNTRTSASFHPLLTERQRQTVTIVLIGSARTIYAYIIVDSYGSSAMAIVASD